MESIISLITQEEKNGVSGEWETIIQGVSLRLIQMESYATQTALWCHPPVFPGLPNNSCTSCPQCSDVTGQLGMSRPLAWPPQRPLSLTVFLPFFNQFNSSETRDCYRSTYYKHTLAHTLYGCAPFRIELIIATWLNYNYWIWIEQ